jgi:hypothetical protein
VVHRRGLAASLRPPFNYQLSHVDEVYRLFMQAVLTMRFGSLQLAKMYSKYQEAVDAWRHEKQERRHSQSLLERVRNHNFQMVYHCVFLLMI